MSFLMRTIIVVATFVLTGSFAQAATLEKRIALVIGNSDYVDRVLPTAANDAGLIAQTLQAAGFDVVGARNLDGDALRASLRDFVRKAETSGADTVAVIYFAGYGLQLAGENYIVPLGIAPTRDTDIPVESLRVSDYVRQISALPLKAGIVVLDAARPQTFVTTGNPLAGGLALVEPDPRIFTAFNAAPGTVAPAETGSYGAYAQALAEMIRTGGLAVPELFNRVRLRVNDVTKGAEVPWDTGKLDAPFIFFERAAEAPASVAGQPADRTKPIRAYDARDAYIAALERDTLADYEAFVTAFPNDPLAKRVLAIIAARREAITWARSYRVDTPSAYWSYLQRYPKGPHAFDARRRLAILSATLIPPPTFTVIAYDVAPPPPVEIVYVARPVLIFNDPFYAFIAPPPPPPYFLLPPPVNFVVLPPPVIVSAYALPVPAFVPIPTYIAPPAYIAAPANNVVYQNIHNTTIVTGAPAAAAAAPAQSLASSLAAPAAAAAAVAALPPSVAQRAALQQQTRPNSGAVSAPSTTSALAPRAPEALSLAKPAPAPAQKPSTKPISPAAVQRQAAIPPSSPSTGRRMGSPQPPRPARSVATPAIGRPVPALRPAGIVAPRPAMSAPRMAAVRSAPGPRRVGGGGRRR